MKKILITLAGVLVAGLTGCAYNPAGYSKITKFTDTIARNGGSSSVGRVGYRDGSLTGRKEVILNAKGPYGEREIEIGNNPEKGLLYMHLDDTVFRYEPKTYDKNEYYKLTGGVSRKGSVVYDPQTKILLFTTHTYVLASYQESERNVFKMPQTPLDEVQLFYITDPKLDKFLTALAKSENIKNYFSDKKFCNLAEKIFEESYVKEIFGEVQEKTNFMSRRDIDEFELDDANCNSTSKYVSLTAAALTETLTPLGGANGSLSGLYQIKDSDEQVQHIIYSRIADAIPLFIAKDSVFQFKGNTYPKGAIPRLDDLSAIALQLRDPALVNVIQASLKHQ
ncbi:hypothetical protein [Geotalea sp. SG265]|uniref:hypothetical protein n=1 Tax=Geotalea sp. SG265 TaxID=2922867 RepID=UPI001FAFA46E|nr:hypothetical protein [Geotalea sp. SG265]